MINDSPYQVRIDQGEIESLAQNIRENGLQQLPKVRPIGDGEYEIVFGHRRVQALRLLGWETVFCLVEELGDKEAASLSVIENLQRDDLNRIEEALAFKKLKELGYKDHEIAEIVGKSRPYVTNALRLLDLDPFLQACVASNRLTVSHTRAITQLPPDLDRYRVADLAIDWGFTVRETFSIVKQIQRRRDFHWQRRVPIDKIIIPEKAFPEGSGYGYGQIIIDAAFRLVGGLDRLIQSRDEGADMVDATVVYWWKWIDPGSNWVASKSTGKVNAKVSHETSRFLDVLIKLVGNPQDVLHMYPVHRVDLEGDYYHI